MERLDRGHTSLASSRDNRGRVCGRGLDEALNADTAAEGAMTSSSVMFVAWDVSMADVSKMEEGSGEADRWRVDEVCDGCVCIEQMYQSPHHSCRVEEEIKPPRTCLS